MVVGDTDKGSKSSDNLENVYDRIQNVKITVSNINVGDGKVTQDDTLTWRFIEKVITIWQEKTL